MLRAAALALGGVSIGTYASACCSGRAALPANALYKSVEGSSRSSREAIEKERVTKAEAEGKTVVPRYTGKPFSGKFQRYTLAEIIPMTHDVALFRFLLPEGDEFNLRPCSTLQAQFKLGAQGIEVVQRFYTPVTANGTKGYFDIIVKRKPQGRMTEHVFGLHVGDQLMFRCIAFKVKYEPNRWEHIGMIAGGTGFTPMLQVINHSLAPVEHQRAIHGARAKIPDMTQLSFLFCNRTERHILLKGLFDRLAREHPARFKMAYSVDAAIDPLAWKGYTGYLTKEMVRETMPSPSLGNKCVILLCGPDQLLNHAAGVPLEAGKAMSGSSNVQPIAPDLMNLTRLGGILGELGYDDTQIYKF